MTVVGKWTMMCNHFRVMRKGNVYWSILRKDAKGWIKRRKSDMLVEKTWPISDSDTMADSYLRNNSKKLWRQRREIWRSMIQVANVPLKVRWSSKLSAIRGQPVLVALTAHLGKPLAKWVLVLKDKIELKLRPIWTFLDQLFNRTVSLWLQA
jgi:hypothetical protein